MKKTLMIIGGVVLGLVIIGGAIFLYLTTTSKKLVCKSKEGNVTILYNNKKITGYTTTGSMTFDIDNQNAYVDKNGIEAYLKQYTNSYANNTTGFCVKK